MPFKSIKGAFRVVGMSPDGDSVRFFPDDPRLVHALPGGPREPQPRPSAQLRLEAIDALETHYAARHQPLALAHRARDRLLDFIGIRNVRWNATQTTVVAADDGTRGHILTRQKDKYGRPIAFLFAGATPDPDGADVFLDADRLAASYNHLALAEGLAYPTYYEGLFADLRNGLTAEVRAARAARRGLWAADATTTGFDATSLAVIMDEVPILPKLFRRLSDYMATTGSAVGFREALGEGDDAVWDLRTQNRTHLDSFVEQPEGTTAIRLTRDPEELVFDPMPARPGNFFAALIGAPISGDPESLPA